MWRFLLYAAALGALVGLTEAGWLSKPLGTVLVVVVVFMGVGLVAVSVFREGD